MNTCSPSNAQAHPFIAVCGAFLALLLLTIPCAAAPGVFMKLSGSETWSTLTGASSETKAPTATEPLVVSGFRIHKNPDKISPLLLQACGGGTAFPRVTLAWRDAAGTVFRVTLENVLITSFSTSAKAGTTAVEECVLTYGVIEWSWFGADGAETSAGGLGTRLDLPAGEALEKTYQPFQAAFESAGGRTQQLRLTCPVERGRTYRISASAMLDGQWLKLDEFTAAEDGKMERLLDQGGTNRMFLRVEALD